MDTNDQEQRLILHVDMDAFFASVEQRHNPELRGKAIAVIGASKRTVVTTCSYEARAYGVKTGMNRWQAAQKCPHLIFVVGNNRLYTRTSSGIIALMRRYTPLVEVFSIDEAFLDVTGSMTLYGSPENVAKLLKEDIARDFGITCSIGMAPNKLLAKLASDMNKPDGLTIIRPGDVQRILDLVPVQDMSGVGKKTARQLALLGIATCGDLGRYPESVLKNRFGVMGERLSRMGRGLDDSPVVPEEESEDVKSVGHSMTLATDISDREDILRFLLQLSEMVGRRARRYHVWGKTVTLSIRYADFDTWEGKQETLQDYINLSEDIYRSAVRLLQSTHLKQPVRLLGVKLSNLRYEVTQLSLFEEDRKQLMAAKAMDAINDRFGDFTLMHGSLLDGDKGKSKGSHVISPAWRPEGIRNVDVK